jgi:hypothetical protein
MASQIPNARFLFGGILGVRLVEITQHDSDEEAPFFSFHYENGSTLTIGPGGIEYAGAGPAPAGLIVRRCMNRKCRRELAASWRGPLCPGCRWLFWVVWSCATLGAAVGVLVIGSVVPNL